MVQNSIKHCLKKFETLSKRKDVLWKLNKLKLNQILKVTSGTVGSFEPQSSSFPCHYHELVLLELCQPACWHPSWFEEALPFYASSMPVKPSPSAWEGRSSYHVPLHRLDSARYLLDLNGISLSSVSHDSEIWMVSYFWSSSYAVFRCVYAWVMIYWSFSGSRVLSTEKK